MDRKLRVVISPKIREEKFPGFEKAPAAVLAHMCHCAHQLCRLCTGLALLMQSHAKGMPEVGGGHNEVAPWVEAGHGCWTLS